MSLTRLNCQALLAALIFSMLFGPTCSLATPISFLVHLRTRHMYVEEQC